MNESGKAVASVPINYAVLTDRDNQWCIYVENIGSGDSKALASLYDESCSLIYGIALRVLRNVEDAEEVTSDVYAQVWRSASNFHASRGSVVGWLTMLARSRAIDRLRAKLRANRQETLESVAQIASGDETPEIASWLGQRRSQVRTALRTLPNEQRQVLDLAYYSGMTQTEIAEYLNQPLGTVKTRMRLALTKLRIHLQLAAAEGA